MTTKQFGISVKADGTTTIGDLSPSAPDGSRITLTHDQVKMLAEIREARFDEDDCTDASS